jgi:hypothetical protein
VPPELRNYAVAFLLTVVLEVGVAWLLGYRKRAEVAAVFWVNVFSHPLVNFLIGIVGALRSAAVTPHEILLFEVGVVIAEWLLLCYALPERSKMRLLVLSLVMNCVSYYFPAAYHRLGATWL